ncbi:hypothetical protein C9374_010552 [Naegleria lovaniensis]|uniref:Uncharacterized protein n=1 Tax=Naegleria lovaniensis TaxID=51637 RepID=A0AA88KE89_NAELO|nr:uncharacterized protein C9374_010552 [Naegleria lovaniensis]KAG2374808.1 hypothetical protein C9374_010552 [Naegleria lovaniensis]
MQEKALGQAIYAKKAPTASTTLRRVDERSSNNSSRASTPCSSSSNNGSNNNRNIISEHHQYDQQQTNHTNEIIPRRKKNSIVPSKTSNKSSKISQRQNNIQTKGSATSGSLSELNSEFVDSSEETNNDSCNHNLNVIHGDEIIDETSDISSIQLSSNGSSPTAAGTTTLPWAFDNNTKETGCTHEKNGATSHEISSVITRVLGPCVEVPGDCVGNSETHNYRTPPIHAWNEGGETSIMNTSTLSAVVLIPSVTPTPAEFEDEEEGTGRDSPTLVISARSISPIPKRPNSNSTANGTVTQQSTELEHSQDNPNPLDQEIVQENVDNSLVQKEEQELLLSSIESLKAPSLNVTQQSAPQQHSQHQPQPNTSTTNQTIVKTLLLDGASIDNTFSRKNPSPTIRSTSPVKIAQVSKKSTATANTNATNIKTRSTHNGTNNRKKTAETQSRIGSSDESNGQRVLDLDPKAAKELVNSGVALNPELSQETLQKLEYLSDRHFMTNIDITNFRKSGVPASIKTNLLSDVQLKKALRSAFEINNDSYVGVITEMADKASSNVNAIVQLIPPSRVPKEYHVYSNSPIYEGLVKEGKFDYNEKGHYWEKLVFPSANPSKRVEVYLLAKAMDAMLKKARKEDKQRDQNSEDYYKSIVENMNKSFIVHLHSLFEVSRQVFATCVERGVILQRIHRYFEEFFEITRTLLQGERKKSNELQIVVDQYEKIVKDVNEEKASMKQELEKILDKTATVVAENEEFQKKLSLLPKYDLVMNLLQNKKKWEDFVNDYGVLDEDFFGEEGNDHEKQNNRKDHAPRRKKAKAGEGNSVDGNYSSQQEKSFMRMMKLLFTNIKDTVANVLELSNYFSTLGSGYQLRTTIETDRLNSMDTDSQNVAQNVLNLVYDINSRLGEIRRVGKRHQDLLAKIILVENGTQTEFDPSKRPIKVKLVPFDLEDRLKVVFFDARDNTQISFHTQELLKRKEDLITNLQEQIKQLKQELANERAYSEKLQSEIRVKNDIILRNDIQTEMNQLKEDRRKKEQEEQRKREITNKKRVKIVKPQENNNLQPLATDQPGVNDEHQPSPNNNPEQQKESISEQPISTPINSSQDQKPIEVAMRVNKNNNEPIHSKSPNSSRTSQHGDTRKSQQLPTTKNDPKTPNNNRSSQKTNKTDQPHEQHATNRNNVSVDENASFHYTRDHDNEFHEDEYLDKDVNESMSSSNRVTNQNQSTNKPLPSARTTKVLNTDEKPKDIRKTVTDNNQSATTKTTAHRTDYTRNDYVNNPLEESTGIERTYTKEELPREVTKRTPRQIRHDDKRSPRNMAVAPTQASDLISSYVQTDETMFSGESISTDDLHVRPYNISVVRKLNQVEQYKAKLKPKNQRMMELMTKLKNREKERTKSLPWLLKFMYGIYKSKLIAFLSDVDKRYITIPEFIFEHLKHIYGTNKLVDEYALALLASVSRYSKKDRRVELFSKFINEDWNVNIVNFYLKVWKACEDSKVGPEFGYGRPGDDGATPHFVARIRCMHVLNSLRGEIAPILSSIMRELDLRCITTAEDEYYRALNFAGYRIQDLNPTEQWGVSEAIARQKILKVDFFFIVCEAIANYMISTGTVDLPSCDILPQL